MTLTGATVAASLHMHAPEVSTALGIALWERECGCPPRPAMVTVGEGFYPTGRSANASSWPP